MGGSLISGSFDKKPTEILRAIVGEEIMHHEREEREDHLCACTEKRRGGLVNMHKKSRRRLTEMFRQKY